MTNVAFDKINQTHEFFKKIIAPLKQHLGINFGYMIVFKDGSYYQIIEDLECLKKWVTNVEATSIFCARNVTTCFDDPYNFTIWPEEPTIPAMKIYKEHGIWNGITISKINKYYTELYWFTKQNAEDGWHKFFVRNKFALYEFIKYFNTQKKELCLTEKNVTRELFKFKHEFNLSLSNSEYIKDESSSVNRMISSLQLDPIMIKNLKTETNLSSREVEVLAMICRGYPYKVAAQKLGISISTIKFHIGNIKSKTGVHFKAELIQLHKNQSLLSF